MRENEKWEKSEYIKKREESKKYLRKGKTLLTCYRHASHVYWFIKKIKYVAK